MGRELLFVGELGEAELVVEIFYLDVFGVDQRAQTLDLGVEGEGFGAGLLGEELEPADRASS